MTVDPRTIAADLEEEALEWGGEDPIVPNLHAACHHLRAVVAPLHDAWLKANPPCPNGCVNGRISGDGTYDFAGKRDEPCPDCPESPGVQPFDKWTAGLVALWTAVYDGTPDDDAPVAYQYLRSIGGVR